MNEIINILIMFRLFIIVRYFIKRSELNKTRAKRVARLYSIEMDYVLTIKCLFAKYPILMIIQVTVGGIALFTQALRISESPYLRGIYVDRA